MPQLSPPVLYRPVARPWRCEDCSCSTDRDCAGDVYNKLARGYGNSERVEAVLYCIQQGHVLEDPEFPLEERGQDSSTFSTTQVMNPPYSNRLANSEQLLLPARQSSSSPHAPPTTLSPPMILPVKTRVMRYALLGAHDSCCERPFFVYAVRCALCPCSLTLYSPVSAVASHHHLTNATD